MLVTDRVLASSLPKVRTETDRVLANALPKVAFGRGVHAAMHGGRRELRQVSARWIMGPARRQPCTTHVEKRRGRQRGTAHRSTRTWMQSCTARAGRPAEPGGLGAGLRDLRAIFFANFFSKMPLPFSCRAARSRPPGSGRPRYIPVNFQMKNIFL